MPTLHLYTGEYGGAKSSFQTAELNLTDGIWYNGGTTGEEVTTNYDYRLTGLTDYDNPLSGARGHTCQITIPVQGVNYVKYTDATEINKCPDWLYWKDEGGSWHGDVVPGNSVRYGSQPDAYNAFWGDYFSTDETGGSTNYRQLTTTNDTPPTFPAAGAVYFNLGWVSHHFITTGMGFFQSVHMWGVQDTQGRVVERVTPFAGGGGAGNRKNYFMVGNQQVYNTAGSYSNDFTQVVASPAGTIQKVEARISTRMKMYFVAFTLPRGINVKTYLKLGGVGNLLNNAGYSEEAIDFVGILTVTFNEMGMPQTAQINAISLDFWQPEGMVGFWGADTGIEGGEGTFTAPSDNLAAGDGLHEDDRNGALSGALASGRAGVNIFAASANSLVGDFSDFLTALYKSEYLFSFAGSGYDPISAIIAYHLLPAGLFSSVGGEGAAYVRAGGFEFKPENPGCEDCKQHMTLETYIKSKFIGSIDVSGYFDAFPDYAPYTKCYLHLPFCGVIEIDPNYVMQGALSVYYITDMLSGNLCAYVWCQDRHGNSQYVYTATGNCAYSIPLFARSGIGDAFGKIVNTGITAAATVSGSVISAAHDKKLSDKNYDIAQGVNSTAAQVASGLWDAVQSSRHGQVTGVLGGNMGIVSDLNCYLEVIRPQWVNSDKYDKLLGIPSEMSGSIASCDATLAPFTGYLKCKAVDVKGITGATEEELAQIESIMMGGFQIGI